MINIAICDDNACDLKVESGLITQVMNEKNIKFKITTFGCQ